MLILQRPALVSDKEAIGALKKHAKKGAAWAQFILGDCYEFGQRVSQSDYEAKRWYEKAAKQGHPRALYSWRSFIDGRGGCSVDLSKARQLTEKAMLLDPAIVGDACRKRLVDIADLVTIRRGQVYSYPSRRRRYGGSPVSTRVCGLGGE